MHLNGRLPSHMLLPILLKLAAEWDYYRVAWNAGLQKSVGAWSEPTTAQMLNALYR